MKVYSKIVVNIETGKTLYSKYRNYTGQVALCKGGGNISYPAPSPQEIELLELQLKSLEDMGRDAEALRPYLLQSMGFREGADGNLLKMTEEEYYESLTGLDKAGYDLAMASTERSLKAYAGELDISPALEKSLGQRKEELEENLSRNLGSDWQSTTAGIQAMAQFDETSELVREEVRSGIITNEGGMALSNLGYMSGIADTDMASFPGAQGGGIFSGAGQMAQHYQRDRQGQFQAGMYNSQARSQRQSGLMSGIGSLMGAGLMAGAMW